MLERVVSTPRPEPAKLLPAVGALVVLGLALPVFLVAGWSLAGWAIGAVLWVATRVLTVVISRARGSSDSVAASGLLAFGLMFKALAVLIVLVAVASSRPHVALSAAIVFGLAYTAELGLSLYGYFGTEPR
jgi:hypothetical protein